MPTKFGAFISGKLFPKLFLLLYIFLVIVSAKATADAMCVLTDAQWMSVATYAVFAIVGILVMTKSKHISAFVKKFLGFLRCFSIYYGMCFAISAIANLIPGISASIGPFLTVAAIPCAIVIVIIGYINAQKVEIKRYELRKNKAGQVYRICLISDIHMGSFVRSMHIEKITRRIRECKPDIVLISGDLFDVDNAILDDKKELKRISGLFRKLKIPKGIYAVLGNHDPDAKDSRLLQFLKDAGIRLLDNEAVELRDIVLLGRTDEGNNVRSDWEDILPQKPSKPVIVLDHKPQGIDEAAQHGAFLTLSGHTHQGQFFPVTIFTKLANGKRYFYGLNQIDNTYGITTAGVGFFELPIRLGTRNEVVDIKLWL